MRREFEIPSSEGLPLRGELDVPNAPRCVVLVVHGFKGFRDWGFFPWITERLTAAGYASIRFDLSRSGIGEKRGSLDRLDLFARNTYSIEVADVRRIIEWAASAPGVEGLPLFLLGHSRGGGISILAAVSAPVVRGVVTWSSIATADRWSDEDKRRWREEGKLEIVNSRTGQSMPLTTDVLDDLETSGERLDIGAALRSIDLPTLFIHGLADESVPCAESKSLAAAARNGSLVLIENGSHTLGATHPLGNPPPQLSAAMRATLAFLNAYCRTTRIKPRTA
ncbi:MAG TPA: alpha/beta fold hydrolase [Thermoanaerobaculia bacterium]|nr:alpha/beta fold hydrolase [Thermoanaerobaculia bacterium]